MNLEWERGMAVTMMGNFLSILNKLSLAEWELWWLTTRDWSIYAKQTRPI